MRRIIVHFAMPKDTAAFDAHYTQTHIPLTKAMPRLRSYEVSKGSVATTDAENPVYLTAILTYDSAADMDSSFASPEGVAAVEDVARFATGGVTIVTVDTAELL